MHGVAELVLAGPQYRRSGTIKLRAVPGGFATIQQPDLAVRGNLLVAGDQQIGVLSGLSYAELAAAADVEAAAPKGLYATGSGVQPDDPILADPELAQVIARAFGHGDAALRLLDPAAVPVLWPEHFDIGITIDEVNYGISPGDGHLPEPYAYIGPWTPREGPFWNVSFGAARPLTELPDAEAIHRFFAAGQRLT